MQDWKQESLGKVWLYTSPRHRFGTDALLLAHFAAPKPRDRALDLCTGCGIIPFYWQANIPPAHTMGVEIQPEGAGQFAASVAAQNLPNIQVHQGDLRLLTPKDFPHLFDLITANPPYQASGHGAQNPEEAHRLARHEEACTLEEVCAAAARLVRFGGSVCLCHRPQRLAELLGALAAHNLAPKQLQFVHQQADKSPWLVLVQAKKGGKAGLNVLPPLLLQDENGPTAAFLDIYRNYRPQAKG